MRTAATWYRWAGLEEIGEYEQGSGAPDYVGTKTLSHIPGLGAVAGASQATGDYRHYLQDHLGSTRSIRDGAKTPLARYAYTPYGQPLVNVGLALNVGYTGHARDNVTQQCFAPYRYYDPGMTRWLKRDPLGFVDGPNLYGYVGGNPVSYTDAWGLDRKICINLHTWIRVTDPDTGRELDLHWTPAIFPGDDRSTAYLIQTPDETIYSPILTINVDSTPDEDRYLINKWRNPNRDTLYYTPIYNCWTCTIVNSTPRLPPTPSGPGHPLPYDPKYPNPQSCL